MLLALGILKDGILTVISWMTVAMTLWWKYAYAIMLNDLFLVLNVNVSWLFYAFYLGHVSTNRFLFPSLFDLLEKISGSARCFPCCVRRLSVSLILTVVMKYLFLLILIVFVAAWQMIFLLSCIFPSLHPLHSSPTPFHFKDIYLHFPAVYGPSIVVQVMGCIFFQSFKWKERRERYNRPLGCHITLYWVCAALSQDIHS